MLRSNLNRRIWGIWVRLIIKPGTRDAGRGTRDAEGKIIGLKLVFSIGLILMTMKQGQ